MPGRYLIDATDDRFKVASNAGVMEFVRRVNPFAHSDVGSVLLDLRSDLPGAEAYCPSYRSLAYVVLHTRHDRIFAIAFGQRGLALRLAAVHVDDALRDGGTGAPEIGSDWVRFEPWNTPALDGAVARLHRWAALAFAEALASGPP